MCKIMNGDASLVLKSLVEVCGWGSDLQDQCSLFGLLSASHLTYLLAQSGVAAATSISTSPSRTQDPNFSRGLPSGAEVLGELLGGGRIGRSLSATLPEESSFVEELLLESAQRLNKLQFPLDVCSLSVCVYYSAVLRLSYPDFLDRIDGHISSYRLFLLDSRLFYLHHGSYYLDRLLRGI